MIIKYTIQKIIEWIKFNILHFSVENNGVKSYIGSKSA